MAIIQLFKVMLNGFREIKKITDQCNQSINDIAAIHEMECAYKMEDVFLSSMINAAKDQKVNSSFDDHVIHDIADKAYEKLTMLESFFEKEDKENLLAKKKDFFVKRFITIELPVIISNEHKESAGDKYNQNFSKRKNKIKELKTIIGSSQLLEKIFCVYLARSNYPKSNAFEILSGNLEHLFDCERKNAKHLKGVKILPSILGLKTFNL